MAKLQEIETKWIADKIGRGEFNSKMQQVTQTVMCTFVGVVGYDEYFASKGGHVIRHRYSHDSNELTVKARLSKDQITIRSEGNIKLDSKNSLSEIRGTLGLLGFKKQFAIYKENDIYCISDGIADLSVVWYIVKQKGNKNRVFIEVEVHGVSKRNSLKFLKKWSNIIQNTFGLTSQDISHQSLYEIYSGKKYRMA